MSTALADLPTSSFTFEPNGANYNIPTGFRFGGLNGGGIGASYNGGPISTAAFTWSTSSAGLSAASLQFTANPEPTTMLLGGLALIPGAVVIRRRRQQKLANTEAV